MHVAAEESSPERQHSDGLSLCASETTPLRPGARNRQNGANIAGRPWLFGALLLLAIALTLLFWGYGGFSISTYTKLLAYFKSLAPSTAITLFGLVYFTLEVLGVPATPLTLSGGYLFGVVTGTIVISTSATAAACVAFLLARSLMRSHVEHLAAQHPKWRALDQAIGRDGLRVVFLLRLSPLLPFSLSSYLYGLTALSWRDYVVGSFFGMLPGTMAYVFAGAAVGTLREAREKPFNPIIVGLGAVATVAAVVVLGQLASEAVSNCISDAEESQRSDGEPNPIGQAQV